MKVKTNIKAGLGGTNHNETLARQAKGLKVHTGVKAGGINNPNHNETLARQAKPEGPHRRQGRHS